MRWVSFEDRKPTKHDSDNDGYVVTRYIMQSGFFVREEYYPSAGGFRSDAILREWLDLSRCTEQLPQREFSNIRKVEL